MTDNKNNQTNQNDEKIEETVVSQENTDDIEDNFLQDELQELESQLQEKDEIAKNSQINYLHLKADFDILQRQTDQKINNAERDSVIKVVKELLPFVENLRKSLLNLPQEQQNTPLTEGVQMMYDNFIKSLEKLHIQPIEAIGLEPDPQFHEPVSMQAVEDKKLKGKIIQEFQQGFVYKNNDETVVIIPSRVIVWS